MRKESNSGFAMGIIIVALVLGVVVVAAILAGSGNAIPFTKQNKYRLAASTVVSQAESITSAIDSAEDLGYTIAQIKLGSLSDDGTMDCSTVSSTDYCLYNTTNGIDEPSPPAQAVSQYIGWKKSTGTIVRSSGTEHLHTTAADDIIFLTRINDQVCIQLNNLSIGTDLDQTPPTGVGTYTTQGWTSPEGDSLSQQTDASSMVINITSFSGTRVPNALCFKDTVLNYNIYYYTVRAN